MEGGINQARKYLRSTLSEDEIDLLLDNWLIANFDSVEITQQRNGSVVGRIVPRRVRDGRSAEDRAKVRRERDSIISSAHGTAIQNFTDRIWDTILPNGIVMRNATGADMITAGGWYIEIGKSIKPTQKIYRHVTTKQMFDVMQRFSKKAA